jgi:signal transduction histidine kinase
VVAVGARQGVREDMLLGMAEDRGGALWLGFLGGVARLDRARLAAGLPAVTEFGTRDGLRSAETTPLAQPAVARGADGRIWFATGNGVAVVDPAALAAPRPPLPVHVEEVLADGRAAGAALGAGTERVEIRFTAAGLAAPERLRFRYRLEGLDRGWVDAEARRAAFYTHLPPGRYRFRVQAREDDGPWQAAAGAVEFRVLPAWYQTWWFFAGCALALAGAAFGAHRLRERQLRRRFALVLAERTRIAGEIHDTLLQGLSGVALQVQAAGRRLAAAPEAAPDVCRTLHEVVEQASRAGAEARRAVWDMRAPGLEEGGLATALESSTLRRARAAEAEVRFRCHGPARRLDPEVEQQLLRIGEEAVSNAVRHAGARVIEVELAFSRRTVRLRVRDDGRGLPEGAAGAADGHWGMVGMRERAARVGAELAVRSAPGQGTEVDVSFPRG